MNTSTNGIPKTSTAFKVLLVAALFVVFVVYKAASSETNREMRWISRDAADLDQRIIKAGDKRRANQLEHLRDMGSY